MDPHGPQHALILHRDGRCVICWTVFNLTVDHAYSRRIVKGVRHDEGWNQLVTLCWDCHQQKDNGSIDSQRAYLLRRLQAARDREQQGRLYYVLRVLVLRGRTFEMIAQAYASQFDDQPAPKAYEDAYDEERKVAFPRRRAARKTSGKRQRADLKAWGAARGLSPWGRRRGRRGRLPEGHNSQPPDQ